MERERNYRLFIVEDAWDEYPRISIIEDPKKLNMRRMQREIQTVSKAMESCYECEEEEWRSKVSQKNTPKLLKE